MTSTDLVRLRSFASLNEFTSDELALLLSASQRRAVDAGEILFRQGSRGVSCILLLEGELDVVLDTRLPERHLATMQPGAFVGQIALVDKGVRSATVRAKSSGVVLELLRDTFEGLLKARSPLALRFQDVIAVAGIRQHRAAVRRLTALAVERERVPERPSTAPAPAAADTDDVLAYIQTAASEWGLSLDDVEVVADETAPKTRRG